MAGSLWGWLVNPRIVWLSLVQGGTYGCAGLDEELADGRAVVHGVEGGDFVNTHGRHLEKAGNLIHDANAGEAVLALTEIEDGHNSGLLVLGRVSFEDLVNDGFILLVEFEGNIGVVIRSVAVLERERKRSVQGP